MNHSSVSGKAAESYVWSNLLQNNLIPYVPLVDVEGVDLVVRTAKDKFLKVQVKSRGFSIPEKGSYSEQIKGLWWEADTVAFDYLIIVLPKESNSYEAWVMPQEEVQSKLTPRGDLNLSWARLRKDWERYYENWNMN